jgi:threonylcarbamoyladenosine tRNA methylthiotransferase MtaB
MVAQATQAAAEGAQEIVLTGVNIGDFGRSTGETFLDLLRALDEVAGIARYRISSIEPNLLSEDVLQFCAQSRAFMPHFHIPLQSGSDEVLRLMHRRYDTALFYNKVLRARELMPDCFIGVDVIVGTRGETAALFDEAESFIRSLPISQLHVFSYSERPGTAALRITHSVSPEEKHERSQRLLAISERKLHDFYVRFTGTSRKVLVE